MPITPDQEERFAEAITRLGGDQEMLAVIASMAIEDLPPLIAETEAHLAAARWPDAATTAHAIKGTLGTFEAGSTVSKLQALIESAKAGNGQQVLDYWASTQPGLRNLLEEIGQLCQTVRG